MLATGIIQNVDTERLQRGVEGLTSGAYAITLTRHTEAEISAYVTNSDGKIYSVTLTEGRSFCGCGDSMFRGKTCKHAVTLALFVIRTPQGAVQEEQEADDFLAPVVTPKLAKMRPWASYPA